MGATVFNTAGGDSQHGWRGIFNMGGEDSPVNFPREFSKRGAGIPQWISLSF